ncbi:hypothetical protein UXU46_01065 [Campylobacter jejuni]
MMAVSLADVLGGDAFKRWNSGVAFKSILKEVAGLAIASTASKSDGLYGNIIRKGDGIHENEMRVTKLAPIDRGVLAILLGSDFEKQNETLTVGLAYAKAESVNVPILVVCI